MNYLIVGLGNIGYEYVDTRHNIGFSVLDAWAKASNTIFSVGRYGSVAQIRVKNNTFFLLEPSTYMNLSGKAVSYWLKFYSIPVENLLVVVDDMALPLGALRLRKQGSDGGHNGLANITEMIGTQNYSRLRLGIGSHIGFGSQVDFVLGKWTPQEQEVLPKMIEKAIEAVKLFGAVGVERAMNQVNIKEKSES
jgi:peptidyl-tRNA hydrolase, PTH1 family